MSVTTDFSLNQQQLVGKGLKAVNVLLINCRKYKVKPIILWKLFDSFIGSIPNYACEISGFSKWNEIERIHLKLLMYIMNTPTTAVYVELGIHPLYISRYERIFKYWFKLIQTDKVIMQTVYKI